MTSPYTLPPNPSYGSNTSIHSAPTSSFYTMKMYETPATDPVANSSTPVSASRYLPPREVPYHLLQGHGDQETGGSAAGISFTNPFAGSSSANSNSSSNSTPPPVHQAYQQQQQQQAQSSTKISNTVANSGATFQPLYATFGPAPVFVSCPYCQHTDETITEPAIGVRSVLCCFMVPVFGLLFKSKWDTRHKCKCCLNVIGTHYAQ